MAYLYPRSSLTSSSSSDREMRSGVWSAQATLYGATCPGRVMSDGVGYSRVKNLRIQVRHVVLVISTLHGCHLILILSRVEPLLFLCGGNLCSVYSVSSLFGHYLVLQEHLIYFVKILRFPREINVACIRAVALSVVIRHSHFPRACHWAFFRHSHSASSFP